MSPTCDVVVAGSGNAALCAALAAREAGASVLIVEKAPESQRGGNSFFTAGGFRFAHQGLEDLRRDILPDISEEEARAIVVPAYTENQFYDDLMRVTEGRADFDMAQHLVQRSRPTVAWMRSQGLRWILMFARQSYQVEGKHQFWGGLNVEAVGGGPGLVEMQLDRARKVGIEVRYGHGARRLLTDDQGGITGLVVRGPEGLVEIPTRAVVLACGGFEANPEMRTRYLGPNWDLARVRGTRHNTGEGIRMALDIGAQAYGHWSSCHAVQWDLNAPPFGDRKVGDMFQKHSYPLGIIVNVHGQRFVDEGADFRNFTYVKYGQAVITPPYVGFGVTCGITFTFGGLRVDLRAQVQDIEDQPIRGLYAAGELVGGLFYHNYPGGAGLMAGSVFGRIAGESAARDLGSARGRSPAMAKLTALLS